MVASLDIVIVNWNAGKLLTDCLQSIVDTCKDGIVLNRVVVVDNASSDGSADGLVQAHDLPLIVMQNQTNRGFGAACNQGAMGSKADHLLLLNPDTRLFEASLTGPNAFMQQSSCQGVGIVGIQLVDGQGEPSRTCTRFPVPSQFFKHLLGLDRLSPRLFPSHHMTEWHHSDSQIVDHVIGAFFWVRRSLFDEMGGFDEHFFVYLEDLDFSLRASRNGWQSFYLADVQAYHKGGGTTEQIKATRLFYVLRSRIYYGYKHFGFLPATLLMLSTVILEPVARLVFAAACRSILQAKETLKGSALLWVSLPAILKRACLR